MNAIDYYLTYVQGETPQHYLTTSSSLFPLEKAPSHGPANAKNLAEWLLEKTGERFRPEAEHAVFADAKRAVVERMSGGVPHIHRACWREVSSAFNRPALSDEEFSEWLYRQEIEPLLEPLQHPQTVRVAL